MGCRRMLGVEDRAAIMAGSEAGKAAREARRRPKKRLLDCDEVLRRRVISNLSQGHTSRQINAPLPWGGVWHTALHGHFSRRSQRD